MTQYRTPDMLCSELFEAVQSGVYGGLKNYGFTGNARERASRWVKNNISVYTTTGRLLEKYNVEEIGLLVEGGEYSVQDGFGWTNGVLLSLMNELEID